MRGRERGQIAIVGSAAGYGGLPSAYAYAPSEAAVISLAVGVERGGFEIRFPHRLALVVRALNLMPYSVYFWLSRRLRLR